MNDTSRSHLRFEVRNAGDVSALGLRPASARWLLVLAHGAGAGMNHPFMERLASELAAADMATFRYQFPYMERRSRVPDAPAVLTSTVGAAVRAAVVGFVFELWACGAGRAGERGEFLAIFAKEKGVQWIAPADVGAAHGGGPLKLEVPDETGFELEGLLGFDLEFDDGAGLIDGGEESFADRESITGIDEGGGFGMRDDSADERFRRYGATFGEEGEAEIAENFERIDPSFDGAGFVAEEAGFFADGSEKFPRTGGAGDFELCTRGGGVGVLPMRRNQKCFGRGCEKQSC